MSEKENDVQAEEVQDVQESNEVHAIDYQDILKNYAESAQNLGQIIWVDSVSEKSNKINVVRILKDGTKQLFSLTVSEENELVMNK